MASATIAIMLFTYNIANGLTAGVVLYPIVKVASGRYRELNSGSVVLEVSSISYSACRTKCVASLTRAGEDCAD